MRFLFQGQLSFMSLDGSVGPKEQTQRATCICVYIYIWKYTVHTKNNHISQVLKYLGGLEIEFLSGFSCRIWGFLQARVRGGSPWWLTSINRSRTWTTCAPRPFSRDVKSRCWAFLGTFTSREGPFFSQILRRYHANKYVKDDDEDDNNDAKYPHVHSCDWKRVVPLSSRVRDKQTSLRWHEMRCLNTAKIPGKTTILDQPKKAGPRPLYLFLSKTTSNNTNYKQPVLLSCWSQSSNARDWNIHLPSWYPKSKAWRHPLQDLAEAC